MRYRAWVWIVAVLLAAGCGQPRSLQSGSSGSGSSATTACTNCHGSSSNGNAAPPLSVKGATATTDWAVGAHQQHLSASAIRSAIDCAECHVVPTTANTTAHIDGTAKLTWGSLASQGGVSPTYTVSSDGSTATCTTYCHGASLGTGNGSNHAPSWTRVDGSQASCGTCHGVPPPSPHPAVPNGLLGCAACHPGTIRSDGTIDVAGGLHIDGKIDIAGGACTSCHGDATRAPSAIAAAPPLGTHGETATTTRAVGAHQAHLVAGHVSAPVACTECHVIPTSTASHPNGTVTVTFGSLASSGSVASSWSGTTCATYCHGASLGGGSATAPVWTRVDGTQRQCGSCHGTPPPASSGHPSVSSALTGCAACHPATVNADGTIDIAGGKHIDGIVQVSGQTCTAATATRRARPPPSRRRRPIDTKGNTATTAAGVGAHQKHLVGGSIRGAMACTDCHTVPTDTTHSTPAAQPDLERARERGRHDADLERDRADVHQLLPRRLPGGGWLAHGTGLDVRLVPGSLRNVPRHSPAHVERTSRRGHSDDGLRRLPSGREILVEEFHRLGFAALAYPFGLVLAQLDPSDLAADGLRQFRDEFDDPRDLEFRQDLDAVLEELQGQFAGGLVAVFQDDVGLDQLMPLRIRDADHRRLADGGMFDHGAFDLEGSDAEIRGLDYIVGPADKPPVAVDVKGGPVAGIVVAVS